MPTRPARTASATRGSTMTTWGIPAGGAAPDAPEGVDDAAFTAAVLDAAEALLTPVLKLHGGADDVISFHGGFRKAACLLAIPHWAKDWEKRNGLELRDDVVPARGTRHGVQHVYGDGLVMLVYAGDDVGHVWMPRDTGNADLDASA
ncbi:hypothetical protein DL764_006317 [Monosporascus ibericus]|uniref:Uncharacterized protein n=1 Tax=Monosporascus ibericus TaxID=155417 RepID=A0A4Q4T7H6_9PEZI|nr:hypothetical protein DL764_006317 [Monosporascus ibericus]